MTSPTSNEYPGFVILNVLTSDRERELTVLLDGNCAALCVRTTSVTIPTKVVIADWTFAQLPGSYVIVSSNTWVLVVSAVSDTPSFTVNVFPAVAAIAIFVLWTGSVVLG